MVDKLAKHIQKQTELRETIVHNFEEIDNLYLETGLQLKGVLRDALESKLLVSEGKLAFTLLNLQNDLVFASKDYENILLANMALLDVLADLLKDYPQLKDQIDIIVSQEAHYLDRKPDSKDVKALTQAYGEAEVVDCLSEEQRLLLEEDLEHNQFGLRCLGGTIGAEIPLPIQTRLDALDKNHQNVYRFANLGLDATKASLQLKKEVQLGDEKYLEQDEGIYDPAGLTYAGLYQKQDYQINFLTGLHANFGIQATAASIAALKKAEQKLQVIDACVHYLLAPGASYDLARNSMAASIRTKGGKYITNKSFQSNHVWFKKKEHKKPKSKAIPERLTQHLEQEEAAALKLHDHCEDMELNYQKNKAVMKEKLKEYIREEADAEKGKLAITLVGIQNDKVIKDFPSYILGAENAVKSNMLLLDVILEIIKQEPGFASKIEIITINDVHVLGRSQESADVPNMVKALGDQETETALLDESNELEVMDLNQAKLGLHCIKGTLGAEMPQPIVERLQKIRDISQKTLVISHFGKCTMNAHQSAIKLKDDVNPGDPKFLAEEGGIFDDDAIAYSRFITEKNYNNHIVTGVYANFDVLQLATSLGDLGEKLDVLDACIHYAIPVGKTYAEVKDFVWGSFDNHGVDYAMSTQKYTRSNPECIGFEEAEKFYKLHLEKQLDVLYAKNKELMPKPGEELTDEFKIINELSERLKATTAEFLNPNSGKTFRQRVIHFKSEMQNDLRAAKIQLPPESEIAQLLASILSVILSVCTLGLANLITGQGMFTLVEAKTDCERKVENFEAFMESDWRPPMNARA